MEISSKGKRSRASNKLRSSVKLQIKRRQAVATRELRAARALPCLASGNSAIAAAFRFATASVLLLSACYSCETRLTDLSNRQCRFSGSAIADRLARSSPLPLQSLRLHKQRSVSRAVSFALVISLSRVSIAMGTRCVSAYACCEAGSVANSLRGRDARQCGGCVLRDRLEAL